LAPKILVLTGGEPTILPRFIDLLQEIRKRLPEGHLYLNTNGVNINVLLHSIDFLDGILFSLDGAGEVNRASRGVRGEKIISNLRQLQEMRKKTGKPKLLKVMTVVTKTNFPFLRQLLEEVETIGDGIEVIMKPRLPYTHPDSIASSPEALESYFSFWEKNRKRFNFWVYGLFAQKQFHSPSVCYAQFFFSRIDNREKLLFCNLYDQEVRDGKPHVVPRPCPYPCDCKEYIDEIFFGRSKDSLSPNARLVLDMLSREELQSAEEFIQTYLDRNYRMPLLEAQRENLQIADG
jgi:MoaA/NifB/PqqE/SkfB family radical SAM enzyme